MSSLDTDFHLVVSSFAMARQRLNEELVVRHACKLADDEGFGAVTLSSVAAGLGVATSALYNHCAGLDGLHHQVAVASTQSLVESLRTAAIGAQGDHALVAMAAAYRAFATSHPGQFASLLRPPPSDGDDRLAAANQSIIDTFVLVYTGMGFDPQQCAFAARSTFSAIHGFLALEHTAPSGNGDSDFEHLIETLRRGLLPDR